MYSVAAGSWISEATQSETLPFLAAVVAVTTVLMILARRRSRQSRAAGDRPRRAAVPGLQNRANMNQEVGDLMLQLQTVAREITGQIDTRYRLLEAVIRDADRKIARLEKLAGPGPSNEKPASRLDVIVGDDCEMESTQPQVPSRVGLSSRTELSRDEIYTLADAGATAVDIARRIGRPTGEVELVLSLRPSRQAAASAR